MGKSEVGHLESHWTTWRGPKSTSMCVIEDGIILCIQEGSLEVDIAPTSPLFPSFVEMGHYWGFLPLILYMWLENPFFFIFLD
jgi:hypothetical protein